ncbi:hypothetical protein CIHG_06268 [Coccidioides immitis H538.4]|uniref:Uncharacterized protein n=2 Tax=Coccidioides immitis TaxID=5501 RepID=A0A0J8QTD2_COCIT|nr:hypothetical protein CISG_04734 [Coccidioides immitis RMSCC 3703]KMU88468.1 hypothetical protein CIHG_06268 [Coccidioides immitis H538.4]
MASTQDSLRTADPVEHNKLGEMQELHNIVQCAQSLTSNSDKYAPVGRPWSVKWWQTFEDIGHTKPISPDGVINLLMVGIPESAASEGQEVFGVWELLRNA